MALEVSAAERGDGSVVISVAGSVDASNAGLLEARVDDALRLPRPLLLFDLTGLAYISSAGLRILLKARKAAARGGGRVLLIGLCPRVKRILDLIHAFSPEELQDAGGPEGGGGAGPSGGRT